MMRHPKDLDGIGLHAPEHAENVLSFPMRVVLKPQLSRRTLDHFFWCGMALLLTGGVLLGFAHTYYFAGFLRAKLPSTIIQIHGVVFSLWFVGLLVQTFLVPFGRIHWHRRIGFVNYGVAVLVVVFGVWAAVDALRRGVQIGSYDLSASFAVSSMDMVAFSAVIIPSYFARRRPDAHKRLILFATLSIMDAALDRWPYEKMGLHFSAHTWTYLGLLLMPVAYDIFSLRRVHPSTLWAGSVVYALNQIRLPIGRTHLWHALCQVIIGWR